MNRLYVNSFVEKKIKRGVQLLDSKDFQPLDIDDQVVDIFNQSKQFLGTGYLSLQNKGIGWFLSSDKVSLTEDFLVNLITTAKIKRQSFENSSLTTAYRLFNQDGDNLGGITIDRYAVFVVFSWYNTFIYEHRM